MIDTRAVDVEALLDAAPVPLIAVDRRGRVTCVNAAAASALGVPAAAMVGRDLEQAGLRPDRRAATGSGTLARVLRGEQVVAAPLQPHPARGPALHVSVDAAPLRDATGETTGAVVCFRDVGPAAAPGDGAVQRSRFAAVFDHARDAIILTDDDGRCLDVNPAACELLARSRDELLATSTSDVLEPEVVEQLLFGPHRARTELRRGDGGTVVVEGIAVASILPGVHLSIWRDVTELDRTTRALQASEAQLRELVAHLGVGVVLAGRGGDVTFANETARALLVGSGEPVGRPLATVLADGLEIAPRDLELLMERDGPDTAPLALGTRRSSRNLRVWRRELGGPAAGTTVVVLDDVTAAREAERALQVALGREREASSELVRMADLKDTFLSAVSHELRTPLTAVGGIAETLRRHSDVVDPETSHRLLDRLTANVERLTELLDDLLDLDRLSREADVLVREPVDLVLLAHEAAANYRDRGWRLSLPDGELIADVDAKKVQRILENLVANALRHTPVGSTVEIGVERDGRAVLIRVDDDGPGVADDARERLFEIFEKGRGGVARSGGTGIGLALVSEFARLHGGRAEVTRSRLGGASFRVRLPERSPRQGA